MTPAECLVTVGVDTHNEVHVAVARTARAAPGRISVATTPAGYAAAGSWARRLGPSSAGGSRAPAATGLG